MISWDAYYINLAEEVSVRSKDPSTRCGAIIVRPDRTLASTGYNGFCRRMPDSPELYADRSEKLDRIIHAEVNAAIHCRDGSLVDYVLYTFPLAPCNRCACELMEFGISTFVFPKLPEHLTERWGASIAKTKQYFKECSVVWREI